MKKILMLFLLAAAAAPAYARAEGFVEAAQPAECNLPKEAAAVPAAKLQPARPVVHTEKEAKKAFKARRRQIKKLVKKYRKASEAEKPAVKAELETLVSQGMDLGLQRAKAYISAQRANLDRLAEKLAEEEKDWPAAKAKRVDDILSGEAERKYKEAWKNWKTQMKAAKREMK